MISMTNKNDYPDELSSSMTGGRLRRYAKVTSAMGGLAARLAGEKYLGIKIDSCLLYTSPSPRDS